MSISSEISARPSTSDTQINSRSWLWSGRAAFFILCAASLVFSIQLFPLEIDYLRSQADTHLTDAQTPFYFGVMLARNLVRLVCILTGVLIFWRKSNDRIGVLAGTFLVAFGAASLNFYQYTPQGTALLEENNIMWGNSISGLGWMLSFPFSLVFPDGRFVPRWMVLHLIPSLILVGLWGLPSHDALYPLNWDTTIFSLVMFFIFVPLVATQVYRYRRVSTPTQRQQTKWVMYGLLFVVVSVLVLVVVRGIWPETFEFGTIAGDLLWLFSDFITILIPITLLMAMLRQRLWDVDILINRSLVYGAATALLAVIFILSVVIVQRLLGASNTLVSFIVSAIGPLALFNPTRKRIQHTIDQRLYRFNFDLDQLKAAQKTPEIKNPGALTGKQLGAYTVLGVLGKGGMGEVYKGQDGGNVVALKILAEELAHQSEFLARFQREAQTGMALDHPHIVRVHDVGAVDGVHYMAMDYVEGFDMARHLKQRSPMPPEDVIDLLRSITHALDYAHGQGLVHRDLKPSNIMLRPRADGETYDAVLMDFGIAKISGAGTRYTGTGTIGTIDYMAPEQITTAREVDHRADIYALGIMAYEMLTGKRPFEGSAPQVMFAHLQQPAPDPRDIQPDIPRTAAKAILKALEKNPDDRFDSAGAFLNALMGS